MARPVFSGWSLEAAGNRRPRGMITTVFRETGRRQQNSAYNLVSHRPIQGASHEGGAFFLRKYVESPVVIEEIENFHATAGVFESWMDSFRFILLDDPMTCITTPKGWNLSSNL